MCCLALTSVTIGLSPLSAAELILDYDVSFPGAWADGKLSETTGSGSVQSVPEITQEQLDDWNKGDFNHEVASVSDLGPPQFVSGKGPGGRSYLSFTKFAALVAEAGDVEVKEGVALNTEGLASGYTMEALVRISPEIRSTMPFAIGSGGQTTFENSFLRIIGKNLQSSTTVYGHDSGEPESQKNTVVTFIPFDKLATGDWSHLTKVCDPASKKALFYLDGVVIAESDISELPENGFYPGRMEFSGLVGRNERMVEGLDFSFFRAYRGAMTAAEVVALSDAARKPLK